jgi:hypothetical protein
MIGNHLDGFVEWQHAGGLPGLLFGRSMGGHPFGDEALLLLVHRQLRRSRCSIALLAFAQVPSEPPVSLGRDLSRRHFVGIGVEAETTMLRRQVTSRRRGRRMHQGAPAAIIEKCLRHSRAAIALDVSLLRPCRPTRQVERLFELMISGRFPKQLVETRWRLIRRWRVDASDASFAVMLVPWPQLQSRHSLSVDADEMESAARDVDPELLDGVAIPAGEQ